MDDPRLITLLTLIKIKNYTKTAQELYITQPAVTNHIKSLEHEFNVELFKDKRSFDLTEQGRILVEYARRIRNQNRELTEAITNSLSLHKILNIGVTDGCQTILGQKGLLSLFFSVYQSEATISVMEYKKLIEDLKAGKLDFALIDKSFDDELFDGIVLANYPIVPVCSREGKFKEIRRITRAMLKSNPIILGKTTEGMTELALNSLKNANINLSHSSVYYANSFYLMEQLIINTDGIGFLYEALLPLLPHVKKMDLSNFEGHQNIYLLYSQNTFDKATLRELLRGIKLWHKN